MGTKVNIGQLQASVIDKVTSKIADNISNNNIIVKRIPKKNYDGGATIRETLMYAENNSYSRYNRWQKLNISTQDVLDAAIYNPKHVSISASLAGTEEAAASGDAAVLDLWGAILKNAELSHNNYFNKDCFGDGTLDGGLQINGIQSLVPDSGGGVLGGIDASANDFWSPIVKSAASDFSAATSKANIKEHMLKMMLQTLRGEQMTNLILADNNYWEFYHNSLDEQARYTGSQTKGKGESGYQTLTFMGQDVVNCGGYQGAIPADRMYFLNTEYFCLRQHSKRKMKVLDNTVPVDQDGKIKIMVSTLNITCSNRKFQQLYKA